MEHEGRGGGARDYLYNFSLNSDITFSLKDNLSSITSIYHHIIMAMVLITIQTQVS